MKLLPLTFGIASTLGLTSTAMAGDYIVRIEAVVDSIDGNGSAIAPFSGAFIGDTMVVEYSVFAPGTPDPSIFLINGSPVPGNLYEIDYAASSLTLGGQQVALEDTVPPPFVDGVSTSEQVNGVFGYAGAGGGFLSLTCWDLFSPSGTFLPSSDLAAAVGTSYDPLSNGFFSPWLFYSDEFGVNPDGLALAVTDVSVITDTSSLGAKYCQASANSTGQAAAINAEGSRVASENDLTLTATGMPASQFGIFIASETQASTPLASGTLCVGGSIVRFQGPGQILQSDANGGFSLQIDTQALPLGTPTPISAGETWNFTAWFRDADPQVGPTANFTDGVSITFE